MKENMALKKLLLEDLKKPLPSGWGRSVVAGNVVVTPPGKNQESQKSQDNFIENQDQMKPDLFNSGSKQSYNEEDDYSQLNHFEQGELDRLEGRMRVAVSPEGEEFYVERDITDPNSMYMDPETNQPFFDNLEELKASEDEFLDILKELRRGR